MTRASSILACALVLAACGDDGQGGDAGVDAPGDVASEVDNDVTADADATTPDEVDATDDGDDGEDCPAGAAGCACDDGNRCDDGLRCTNLRCVICPPGAVGCPCLGNGACDGTLTCGAGNVCVDPGCVPGSRDCPCDAGDCQGALVCDEATTTCRDPVSCATAGCVAEQRCREAGGGKDAACLSECEPGFTWNAAEGRCDVAAASCSADPDDPTSILAACAAGLERCVEGPGGARCEGCVEFARPAGDGCVAVATCVDLGCGRAHRRCVPETTTSDAACGACADGFVESGGACVSVQPGPVTCGDLACAATEVCHEGADGGDAYCEARRCRNPDEAWDPTLALCVDCTADIAFCGLDGETGKYWSETTVGGACLCETTTGYYADLSNAGSARPCDADGDGWVRLPAKSALESDDAALTDNARCAPRAIDRFVLRNEWGETRELRTCEAGLAVGACTGRARTIGLYETVRLDQQAEIDLAPELFPPYAEGGVGRSLRAGELNPLTRACVSNTADHNDNAVADVNEGQDAEVTGELAVFTAVGYFVELHRGYYEAVGDGPGRYVIEERSRCDGLPLTYGDADGAGDYWRECTRNRDAGWDPADPDFTAVGYDFARWSCDDPTDQSGTCATPPPPAPPSDGATISAHGLCDPDVTPTDDGYWRGMNHHSQFKCVKVAAQPGDPTSAPQVVSAAALYTDRPEQLLWLDRCHVACAAGDPDCADDCDAGGCTTSATPAVEGPNPASPNLVCEAALGSSARIGEVGFAAVRYHDRPGAYQRGCIDEWEPGPDSAGNDPWRDLCPSFGASESRSSDPLDFGALVCCESCGDNEYCGPGTECAACPTRCTLTQQCGAHSQDGCGDPCVCEEGSFCSDPGGLGTCAPWPDGDRCHEPLTIALPTGVTSGRIDDLDASVFHDNFARIAVTHGAGGDTCAATLDGVSDVASSETVGEGTADFFVRRSGPGFLHRLRLPGYGGGGRLTVTAAPAAGDPSFCQGAPANEVDCAATAITAANAARGIELFGPLLCSGDGCVVDHTLWFEDVDPGDPLDLVIERPSDVAGDFPTTARTTRTVPVGQPVFGDTTALGDWGWISGPLVAGPIGTGLGAADQFWTVGPACTALPCAGNESVGIHRIVMTPLDASSGPDLLYVVPELDLVTRGTSVLDAATAVHGLGNGFGATTGSDGKLGLRARLDDALIVVDGTTPARRGGYSLVTVPAYSCQDPIDMGNGSYNGNLTHTDPGGAATSRSHPGLDGATTCGIAGKRLVFHTFTAPADGSYTFWDARSFGANPTFEPLDVIAVARGCGSSGSTAGPALTFESCAARVRPPNDFSAIFLSVELQQGVTYFIGVNVPGESPRGDYGLRVVPP